MASRIHRLLRVCLLVLAAFTGGIVANRAASATTEADSPYALLDQMARVLVLIENEYVEPVDRARLIEGSIKGMVAELDPHSAYLPREDYAIFQSDTKGSFGGIGVEVDFSDDAVVVIAPIEDSPAYRAGIHPGDRIIAIDNVSIRGKSPDALIRQMRGPPGTSVLLTVRRAGAQKLKYFKLTREVIQVSSVRTKLLKDDVAYLRIKQFQEGTHAELLAAIGRLRAEAQGKLSGVLLDMRNNPGGLVDEAAAVADEFLTGGVIYTTRHRGRVINEVHAGPKGALRRGPVVVLVNEYSASAAELVAGALSDHHRAPVVGTRTFGKGSVQTIVDLPGGAGLRLTTMRYYTPGGRAIQAQGIKPSVVIQAAYAADRSFGVVREADLEDHLPTEGARHEAPPPTRDAEGPAEAPAEPDAEESVETHLGVARDIPSDPTGGPDFQLSVAYQIVTGVMGVKQ
jgi:carboxyl-terminal processing protease